MRAAAITTSTTPGLHLVLCCCYCIGGNREKPQSRKRALHEGHRACCFAAAAAAAAIDAFSTQILPLPGHHSCDGHIASKRSNCAPEHKDTECMPVVMTPHAHSRRRCRRCRHRCCHHHCRTAAATAATININTATASIICTCGVAHTAHALLFLARNSCAAMVLSHSTACDMTGALRCALPPLPHPPRQGYTSYYAAVIAFAAIASNRNRASELCMKATAPAVSLPLPPPPPPPLTLSPRR